MTPKTTTPGRRTQPDEAPGRPPCQCGCGGTPKGKNARFLPGHDAKLASAHRSALRDDQLQLEPVAEWNLPTDRDGFLDWLKGRDLTLRAFRKMPAWANAPG